MPETTTTETTTNATLGTSATPVQVTQPPAPAGATPAAGTNSAPPATGDEALGEAGKVILRDARRAAKEAEDRAKAAETERDALKAATQSDSEKATAAAVKEAEGRLRTEYEARIRRSEVRRSLTAAGVTEVDLAAMAPEFANLKLTDSGDVEKLPEAIEAFKAAHPSLFGGNTNGTISAGLQTSSQPAREATLEEAVTAHYTQRR